MEAKTDTGLVKGHAYSVTAVKKIKLGQGILSFLNREYIEMVRCRNPWGGTEWKGAWSDGQVTRHFLTFMEFCVFSLNLFSICLSLKKRDNACICLLVCKLRVVCPIKISPLLLTFKTFFIFCFVLTSFSSLCLQV